MTKEKICKNCKYHYIEEISFDYPQSCCSKRNATTEGWCKCNDFEYSDRYIEQLQRENNQLKVQIEEYQKALDKTMSEKMDIENNWNKLKEYIRETKLKEFEKSYGKRYGKTFTQAEIIVCNMILDKMQELEQGSDGDE